LSSKRIVYPAAAADRAEKRVKLDFLFTKLPSDGPAQRSFDSRSRADTSAPFSIFGAHQMAAKRAFPFYLARAGDFYAF